MIVLQNYTFTPGEAGQGTIVISDIFALENFASIINVTRNATIYNPLSQHDRIVSLTTSAGQTTLVLADNTIYWDSEDSIQILLYDSNQAGNALYGGAATATTAFGEPIAAQITPVFQLDGIYGLPSSDFEQYTNGTGSVSSSPVMAVSTGSGGGGYGVLRSRRVVRYRPGQGAMARFTAQFSTPLANYTQRAGFFSQEQAVMVGYNGTSFGVLRENGGKAHIAALQVTAHSGGAETVTVTLNGTPFTVPVSGTTIEGNVIQLGTAAYAGWSVDYSGDTIFFLSNTLGPKTGTFSVTTSVGGVFAGTITTQQAGVSTNAVWTPQSQWNVDRLDGTGPSGMDLDPQTLNVFQINFRWLGAGEIRYAIENSINGDMIFFHHEHYSNKYTTPHLDNPSLKIGYVAADLLGSGTGTVSASGASMMGAIEGIIQTTKWPHAASGSRTTTMNAGSTYHILSVRNKLIASNKINTREILLKKLAIGASAAASAPCFVYLYIDPTYSTSPYYTNVTTSTSQSTTAATLTGSPIAVFTVTTGSPDTIDLDDLRITLPANTTLALGISSTATLQRADASLTFIED